MTVPSGPFQPDADFGITGDDGSVPGQAGNNQDAIMAALKARQLSSPGWNNSTADVWSGLRRGAPLPLAIAEMLINGLFGTSIEFDDMGTLIDAIEQVPGVSQLIDIIQSITGIDLRTIFDGIDVTQPGAVLTVIQAIVGAVIDAIISAFTGSSSIGNDVTALLFSLINPFSWLKNLGTFLQSLDQQQRAIAAGQQNQINVLAANVAQLAAGTSTTVNSVVDDFNRPGPAVGPNWHNVSGALTIQPGGFIQTSAFAAGYYDAVHPATDKHFVSVRIENLFAGTARAWMCGDTAMSNYAAVEIHRSGWGGDYVRLVFGSSESVVVAQKQANFNGYQLQNGWVIQLKYDDVNNTFYVLKNGIVIPELVMQDVGNAVTHGPAKRVCGVVSNADNLPYAFGPGLTDYMQADW